MKQSLRLVLALTLICFLAGLLLAWINRLTREPIARAALAERLEALKSVLPPSDPLQTNRIVRIEHNGVCWSFQPAFKAGRYVGAAFETATEAGYGGTIRVMVGVAAGGQVKGIEILEHRETPGLGARIADDAFKNRFRGRDAAATRWAVSKDQGDIDQITAATISSRAVVEAVARGLRVYREHAETIRKGGRP